MSHGSERLRDGPGVQQQQQQLGLSGCAGITSAPTNVMTRVTQRMMYSFSRESGRLKAPNSFCSRSLSTGATSAMVKRGCLPSCTSHTASQL